MDFISNLSSDLGVILAPAKTIIEWLEPMGKVASAVAKLIGLMPK